MTRGKYYLGFIFLSCLSMTATSQDVISIDFDTSSADVYIDTNLSTNIWQIGAPQKTYFTSALTLPNAIVTDTINSYPPNNLSAFYIAVPNVYWSGVNLQFKHKYDTDSLMDGGKIEVSSDMINWSNLINGNFNLLSSFGFYSTQDTISSMGGFGFSGRPDGWQFSLCYWNYPNVDTLYLRFVFTSDNNQSNKDGWMIDSIRIWTDLGIGVNEMTGGNLFQISPNPATEELRVEDAGLKIREVEIYDILGQRVFSKKPEATSQKLTIDVSTLKGGIYFIKIKAEKQERLGKFVKE